MSSLEHVPEGVASQEGSSSSATAAATAAAQSADSSGGGGKDILADLSAFQAEIDALRAQIGK